MGLVTEPNLADPDRLYEALVNLHQGLTHEQSLALNTRLILILLNQIGDAEVIGAAFALAAETAPDG